MKNRQGDILNFKQSFNELFLKKGPAIALIVFSFSVLLSGCLGGEAGNNGTSTVVNASAAAVTIIGANASNPLGIPGVERVEVIHFHGEHQCYSCLTVGNYAEETVNTYFSKELKDGRISFAHVNAELPENQGLVAKYRVTGASLWIGVYDKTGFHKEENVNVWYKIGDKRGYMDYLKQVLDEKLGKRTN